MSKQQNRPLRIAIFGASGFLGKRLSVHILEHTDWHIDAIARNVAKLTIDGVNTGRYSTHQGDVTDYDSIRPLLQDVDVAYYFVHMMGHKGVDFYAEEQRAARTFVRAADDAGLPRIVYMGGLGDDTAGAVPLSKHLASRHLTGEILRSARAHTIEFRASMILGRGSVAFDIIAAAADRLPLLPLPRSAATMTQPIAIADALAYLQAAATVPLGGDEIVGIGGADKLSYKDVYLAYAKAKGLHRTVFRLPFIPNVLSSLFLDIITPRIHARIGRSMVESMAAAMVVQDDTAHRLFPDIRPVGIGQAMRRALQDDVVK